MDKNNSICNVIDEYKIKYKYLKDLKEQFAEKKVKVFKRITVRLGLATLLTIACFNISKELDKIPEYKHVITPYSSTKDSLISLPTQTHYSKEKSEFTPELIIKAPWEEALLSGGYIRNVYTYKLNEIDVDKTIEYVEKGNYSNINDVLKLLPDPVISVETNDYANLDGKYNVVFNVDTVNGEKIHVQRVINGYVNSISIFILEFLIWCVSLGYIKDFHKFISDIIQDPDKKIIDDLENDVNRLKLKLGNIK